MRQYDTGEVVYVLAGRDGDVQASPSSRLKARSRYVLRRRWCTRTRGGRGFGRAVSSRSCAQRRDGDVPARLVEPLGVGAAVRRCLRTVCTRAWRTRLWESGEFEERTGQARRAAWSRGQARCSDAAGVGACVGLQLKAGRLRLSSRFTSQLQDILRPLVCNHASGATPLEAR